MQSDQPGQPVGVVSDLEDVSEESGTHSRRVAARSHRLGQQLGLTTPELDRLRFAGLVHDIGKLGTPERILNKRAQLNERDLIIMNAHPIIGASLGRYEQFSDDVVEVILYHHERFDGAGYPARLHGENIPLFARIVAVADAYDTIISRRVYKEAQNIEYAISEIVRCAGTQFDPEIARAFVRMKCQRFQKLKEKFGEYI